MRAEYDIDDVLIAIWRAPGTAALHTVPGARQHVKSGGTDAAPEFSVPRRVRSRFDRTGLRGKDQP